MCQFPEAERRLSVRSRTAAKNEKLPVADAGAGGEAGLLSPELATPADATMHPYGRVTSLLLCDASSFANTEGSARSTVVGE
jgi:hypothetical protein